MSQLEKIYAHMRSGKSLTQVQSTRLFRCTRLAARIYDLKPIIALDGYQLETITEHRDKIRFARYRLLGPFKRKKGGYR